MKPKTELELAQDWERLIQHMCQLDMEPGDADTIIAAIEEVHPKELHFAPGFRDDVRRAVAEAINRRNAPKAPVPPGSGKSSIV